MQGDPDPITGGPDLRDFLPQFSTLLFGRTPRDPGADTFTPFATESIRDVFGYLPGRNSNTRQTSRSPGGFRDSFTGLANAHRETDSNAVFRYQTMLQMENLVTVRSNVFAVWITVGYFDAPAGGTEVAPIERNRGFYIVDRSIPVAYERGKDHNVRDAILLRRIIQ